MSKDLFFFTNEQLKDTLGLCFCIYLGYVENKEMYLMYGGQYKKIKDNENPEPSLAVPIGFKGEKQKLCQEIVDHLISRGITPSKPIENKGRVEAMQEHLNDLRTMLKIQNRGENK